MKIKKWMILTLAAALILAMFTGCGANAGATMDAMGGDGYYDRAELSNGIYEDAPSVDKGTVESGNQIQQNQKLIKTVYMTTETEDMDTLLQRIDIRVSELGGYVESRSVRNGSAYSSYRSRSAELVIRIPADQLDGFVEQIQGMSNIVSSNEKVEDVTLSYVAVESRLNALKTEEQRLLELLEMAETIYDLLEVEARLTEVQGELESVTSQLRVLENRISYATLELSIDEVQKLTVVEEETVWQRMSRGFMENLEALGDFIVEFAIWLIAGLPILVPLAAVIILVIILMIRRRKNRKQKPQKNVPFATDVPQAPEENNEQK